MLLHLQMKYLCPSPLVMDTEFNHFFVMMLLKLFYVQ